MKIKLSVLILLLAMRCSAAVTTYYVATNGSSGNSGLSTNLPWPLTYALANAGPSNVVSLMPGNYPIIDLGTPSIHSGLTVKSYFKWQAKITGTSGGHCFATEPGVSNVVVDGLQLANSWIDGIKFNGHNSTARNNWVYNAGKGNPAWVTNTDESFTGQGIAAHNYYGTVIENNLIENCGAWLDHDHGIYINSTNAIIRNNVIRGNLAHGIQIYESAPQAASDMLIYNNLIYGNGRGVVIYTQTNCTNYVFGNTILNQINSINSSPILCRRAGSTMATNNICIGNGYSITAESGGLFYENYNVVSPSVGGPNDIVSSQVNFVNTNSGLFWIKIGSNAKGSARTTVFGPVNFFGSSQSSVADIGAFQYSAAYAADTRTLDPSGSSGADYWAILEGGSGASSTLKVSNLRIGP